MTCDASTGWTVIIPIRPGGKSRLQVRDVDHAGLAWAIALDTIDAASQVACVRVVSADPTLQVAGTELVREDTPRGIDVAVRLGLDGVKGHRAVLLGDLPGLAPEDLAKALDLAEAVDLGAVSDVEGTGTTLVTARSGIELSPSFGPNSWARHRQSGFTALPISGDSSLRRDVDLAEHLRGHLGPRTSAALSSVSI